MFEAWRVDLCLRVIRGRCLPGLCGSPRATPRDPTAGKSARTDPTLQEKQKEQSPLREDGLPGTALRDGGRRGSHGADCGPGGERVDAREEERAARRAGLRV